jgi:hypothetical protein
LGASGKRFRPSQSKFTDTDDRRALLTGFLIRDVLKGIHDMLGKETQRPLDAIQTVFYSVSHGVLHTVVRRERHATGQVDGL